VHLGTVTRKGLIEWFTRKQRGSASEDILRAAIDMVDLAHVKSVLAGDAGYGLDPLGPRE
jgi:hypothetical protein